MIGAQSAGPPRTSVALCTFNGERFLEEQLRSLTAQTSPPREIVVYDDASTDATFEMLAAFATASPVPVRIHQNEVNAGFVRNFERAIAACRGDVIALCDQDDIWEPHKVATIERHFSATPGLQLFFSDALLVDEAGQAIGLSAWQCAGFTHDDAAAVNNGDDQWRLWTDHVVTGATIAFAASLRQFVLPFPARIGVRGEFHIHDSFIAAVAAVLGPVHGDPEILVRYRLHEDQAAGFDLPSRNQTQGRRRFEQNHREWIEGSLTVLEPLSDHLGRLELPTDAAARARTLGARVAHLRRRLDIRRRRARRPVAVLKELRSGGYRQFSNGWRSAGVDLFGL
jgi:glycosyltransferase involved in cell wall biosynthesis